MTKPVLIAGPTYERYRRGEMRIAAPGFELRRVHFESAVDPAGWPANERFACPLFLPGPGTFKRLLVILNGLNDSSYRKFFPWAASIARAGTPVLIFPSAFLMNRRPREWITPGATHEAWQARLDRAPDSATPINAVLSHRVAEDPRSLLNDALHTAADLRQLVRAIDSGQLECDGDAYAPFERGAQCDFLGYSLGGYLALALRLQDPLFVASNVITLCAGGSVRDGLDPVSPLILDRQATALLLDELASMQRDLAQLEPLTALLLSLFSGTTPETREHIARLTTELTILAGEGDQIVPTAGIAQNLGRLDAALPLGIHEYPFNLKSCDAPNLVREIAQSHRIGAGFEDVFGDFIELVLQRLRAADMSTRPAAAEPHSVLRTQKSC